MAVWLFTYWGDMGAMMDGAGSEAGRAGAASGGALGTGMIVTTWALGDVILGLFVLFTRPKES